MRYLQNKSHLMHKSSIEVRGGAALLQTLGDVGAARAEHCKRVQSRDTHHAAKAYAYIYTHHTRQAMKMQTTHGERGRASTVCGVDAEELAGYVGRGDLEEDFYVLQALLSHTCTRTRTSTRARTHTWAALLSMSNDLQGGGGGGGGQVGGGGGQGCEGQSVLHMSHVQQTTRWWWWWWRWCLLQRLRCDNA